MKLTFLGEHRTQLTNPSVEGAVAVLGAFEVNEALIKEVWRESSTAEVSFVADSAWIQNCALPGYKSTAYQAPERRVRYFTMRGRNGRVKTWLAQSFKIKGIGEGLSKVTVYGADPRAWLESMPSSADVFPEDWTGPRSDLLRTATTRCSNTQPSGISPWQRLPITQLKSEWRPTEEQSKIGLVQLEEADLGGMITVPSPDPLPILPTVEAILAEWDDVELYPVEVPHGDGTASPWWQWAIRKRVISDLVFSEKNGSLSINQIETDNTVTETMAYKADDPFTFSYGRGEDPAYPDLRGPWFGAKPESFSIPENITDKTFLRGRALTGNLNNKRVAIDSTINFANAGQEPTPGMSVLLRIEDRTARVPLGEIVTHYSATDGWKQTSAVFIENQSIDLFDPPTDHSVQGPIQFIVQGSSFAVPTNYGWSVPYAWAIDVDGEPYGSFSGVSSETSWGCELDFGFDGEHHITLRPLDGQYSPGWGAAFSFWDLEDGAGSLENKAKLLRVLSDPDIAHNAEYGFRDRQFYDCINLVQIVPEKDDSNTFFLWPARVRAQQYEGCSSLTDLPDEYWAGNTAGDNFRYRQYARCSSVTTAAKEYGKELRSIDYGFRESQYSFCINLTTASEESLSPEATDVYDYFRTAQYIGCELLEAPADEYFPESIAQIGVYFRSSQYAYCASLRNAADEVMSKELLRVWEYFRDSQYLNCWSLETAGREAAPGVTAQIHDGYRRSQYEGCGSLMEAGAEAPITLDGSLIPDENDPDSTETRGTVGGFYRMAQYKNCWNLEASAREEPIVNALQLGGQYRAEQYYGCSGITTIGGEAEETAEKYFDDFRAYQYYGCASVKELPAEVLSNDTLIITNGYRTYQYALCHSAEVAAVEAMHDAVEDIGTNFRNSMYYGCSSLKTPAEELLPAGITAIPNYFRIYQYNETPLLEEIATEKLPDTVRTIGDGYRNNMYSYSGVQNAGGTAVEAPMDFVETVGSYFRFEQFNGAARMVHPLVESFSLLVGKIANKMRAGQYSNCPELLDSGIEADTAPDQIINEIGNPQLDIGEGYRENQFRDSPKVRPTEQSLEIGTRIKKYLSGLDVVFVRRSQFFGTRATDIPPIGAWYKDLVYADPEVYNCGTIYENT